MRKVKGETAFWEMFEENVQTVEDFYSSQISSMRDQFHSLAIEAIRLVLYLLVLCTDM